MVNVVDHNSDFLICGDFNLSGVKWAAQEARFVPFTTCTFSNLITSFMELCSLDQLNREFNSRDGLLDLIFTNVNEPFTSVEKSHGFVVPDPYHPPLVISLMVDSSKRVLCPATPKRNYFKTNFAGIISELEEIDWPIVLGSLNCENATLAFYEIINRLIDHYVPLRAPARKPYPIWFTDKVITNLKEKNRSRQKFKRTQAMTDYNTFVHYRSLVKKEIKEAFRKYVLTLEFSLRRNDAKPFWAHVKRSRTSSSYISSLSFEDRTRSDIQGMCDLFAEYFSSTFLSSSNGLSYNFNPQELLSFEDISISVDEVLLCLNNLDVSTNGGPDTIPNSFAKALSLYLCQPLALIYNKSLSEGVFPTAWKIANIVPIHKKGNLNIASNYRPISILNCFGKIFERLMYNVFAEGFSPLLSSQQHGFCKGKSTMSNLLEFTHYVSQAFEHHSQVDVIYTDLTKAFDRVNHAILISKLELYGFSGSLLSWIESYLKDRQMRVVFNGGSSHDFSPGSGVPQGSILGPFLFLVYINDLTHVLSSEFLLYADDVKIFRVINTETDCQQLQSDVASLSSWCQVNDLELNVNKCSKVTYSLRKSPISFNYTIGGCTLSEVYTVKDLGVTFDTKLKFEAHIIDATNRAYRMCGFILRSSSSFNSISTSVLLFQSLARSILEYGSVVWCPYHACHIGTVESVQRKFTRSLFYKSNKPYADYDVRLRELQMSSLEKRRIYLDECTLFNIIHGFLKTSLISEIRFRTPAFNSRNQNLFIPQLARLGVYFNAPLLRMQRNHDFFQFGVFNISAYQFKRKIRSILFA